MIRRLLAFLLMITMITCGRMNFTIADEPVPTGNPTNPVPRIKLESPTSVTINGGETKTIKLTIRNVGSDYAYNNLTQATLEAGAPFVARFLDNSNITSSIQGGGKKIMLLEVEADKDAKSGNYPINLKHSFMNIKNELSSETDVFYLKIENKNANPLVNMYDFKNSNEKIMPGDSFTISAKIENASVQVVKELQITLEGTKTDEINLANSVTSNYYPTVDPGTVLDLNYKFAAASKIKSGSYPLTFKVTYKDNTDKAYDKSFFYYVNVGGTTTERSQIELQNIVVPTSTFNVGDVATIAMQLKNVGKSKANNIKVTATADAEGAVVPKSSNVVLTRTLDKGETKGLSFSFSPTAKAKTQNYSIKFVVEYETGNVTDNKNDVETFEQYAGINVNNPLAESSDTPQSKPKIIVSSYNTNPLIVKAGSEFDLNLTFKNTHMTKPVENTKVSLTVDEATTNTNDQKGSVFTPVNGSTTFYIGAISPNGQVNKKLRMYTLPTALPKNYSVTVDFEYEDQKHNEVKSTEKIGISVKQPSKLDTSELNIPELAYIGQPASLSFDFYNTGKTNLSNLLIKIEGDSFDTKQSSNYFGKFNSSSSDNYEGMFTPTKSGLCQGKIIISYEDDTGEVTTQVKDFSVNVQEQMPMPSGMDIPPMPQPESKPIWKNIWLWTGVLAIGVVTFFVVKKIRNKKKGFDLDE